MESTQVIIVGAGPAGLTLALTLAQYKIHSVILEKQLGITTDPRGVYLTGDAVRILHSLGLGGRLEEIGHEAKKVCFHESSFSRPPYFQINIGADNVLGQAVPEGLLQIQPVLERVLRDEVVKSPFCTLRTGCTVVGRPTEEPPSVEYKDDNCQQRVIRGQWLIGADGKIGVVRKHFLEPSAGIRQEEGQYRYNGTWVAANLKISLPTPESHPDWPLWDLAYTPQQAYDLFWPEGWHFCSPPGKPTATGRFGPHGERLWRHEFRQDSAYESKDVEALLWEHLTPMITRESSEDGHKFQRPVQFPRDCITVLRCEPFRFTHKVVNKWYDKRTILIGDAAHVFPPFAGQGIGSGLRDAHQLGWRLALITPENPDNSQLSVGARSLLDSWALERQCSVQDAAFFSMLIGRLCNNRISIWIRLFLNLLMFLECKGLLPRVANPQAQQERRGFSRVPGGFFIKGKHGGSRLAQIPVREDGETSTLLSDRILTKSKTAFTLLVIQNVSEGANPYKEAMDAVKHSGVREDVLSERSIHVYLSDAKSSSCLSHQKVPSRAYWPWADGNASEANNRTYRDRIGYSTKFVIIRPDFFLFASARDRQELDVCLATLKRHLGSNPTSGTEIV